MKVITSQVGRIHTEYFVLDLADESIKVDFVQQVEDVLISSPDGDILIGWDYEKDEDFTENNCLLIKPFDNLKEIPKDFCTHFYLMAREKGKILKVYITAQR